MTEPTFAAAMEQVAFVADLKDEQQKAAVVSTTGLLDRLEAARNDAEGTYGIVMGSAVDFDRADVAAPLSQAGCRRAFDPALRQVALATAYPRPGEDPSSPAVWRHVFDFFHANNQSLKQSADTYDTSWSAGAANVAAGETLVRVIEDELGYRLVGFEPDSFELRCTRDARRTGVPHREFFLFKPTTTARPDNLDYTGSAMPPVEIEGHHSGLAIIKNATFKTRSPLTSVTALTSLGSWTPNSDLANYQVDTAIGYRREPGDTSAIGLKVLADDTLYQDLVATGGARFNVDEPFLIAVRVYRYGSATGNATLRISPTIGSGGVSATVALGDLGSNAWGTLILAVDKDAWPANWNANDVKIQLTTGSLATSNMAWAGVIFSPLKRVGGYATPAGRGGMGQWIGYLGGQTAAVRDDVWTLADTEGARGVNSFWLLRKARYGNLPTRADAAEITAAGGRTFTFATSDDSITLSSGNLTDDGYYAGMKLTIADTSSNDGVKTIASIDSATKMTVEENLTDEGPLSATATLNATAPIADK